MHHLAVDKHYLDADLAQVGLTYLLAAGGFIGFFIPFAERSIQVVPTRFRVLVQVVARLVFLVFLILGVKVLPLKEDSKLALLLLVLSLGLVLALITSLLTKQRASWPWILPPRE
jgi:hypothetical protein